MLSAAEFVPLAEESDLILESMPPCDVVPSRPGSMLADAGVRPEFRLWCNVSAHQLTTSDPVAAVLGRPRTLGCDPAGIGIELTETAVMGRLDEAADQIDEVRRHSVRVALDDFGTGHSSLALLRSMTVDELKVDRSFVADMIVDERDMAIIRAMTTLGRELGLGGGRGRRNIGPGHVAGRAPLRPGPGVSVVAGRPDRDLLTLVQTASRCGPSCSASPFPPDR